jgi:superfamily II DNA or RNA helicase
MSFLELTDLKRRYAGQAGTLVNEFFVPVLSRAIRYDRQAGYFDSASLVLIAAGLASFIQNLIRFPQPPIRAPMRVVTGATWSEADVEAYRKGRLALEKKLNQTLLRPFEPSDEECIRLGLPSGWRPETDQIARHRFGALAWMAAAGLMEIRIALPLDPSGTPYRPGRNGGLYHPKAGLLYDEEGNGIYFQGSVNETGAAWARNREKFDVKRSWFSEQDREDVEEERKEFETIWDGRDPQLLIMPLPEAVLERLVEFTPLDTPPLRDPMDERGPLDPVPLRDRVEAQFFLDAPRKPGGHVLVFDPLWADGQPFRPYPHQEKVIHNTVERFPHSFLFCDEVGLGKTIEAGAALRSLLLSGAVERTLLICPRGLVRQWMEELREKLALTAWFYDGRVLTDVAGRSRPVLNPLEEKGIVIVSRHLLARLDRRSEALSVEHPWDVVIVDEAHAARHRVFGDNAPNQFLSLLLDLKKYKMFKSLWLLTATPMQLDPKEVHDLMLLCGLDHPSWGKWSRPAEFADFFLALKAFQMDTHVRQGVVDMTRIAVSQGAPELCEDAMPKHHWQPFGWAAMVRAVRTGNGLMLRLNALPGNQAEAMTPYLARQTPLSVYMFRHTRATLRAYQEQGLVQGLANRRPEDAPVEFRTPEEHSLYERIDELCSRFYRIAELPPEERSGVGFLMAVFRKRLGSSFEAFRKSLERRKQFIEWAQDELSALAPRLLHPDLLSEEDEEDEDTDISTVMEKERARLLRLYQDPLRREQLEAERAYIQDYIVQLRQITTDSKFEVFKEKISDLLKKGHRVIVFTQYLDTLDFIRERLESRFGDKMACYSGRGGEIWDLDQYRWAVVEKSEIKARGRRGHPHAIQILLGTDAASEGLNLQAFSALINYDLPWNPMRVEQRIGRIDRIGQEAPAVHIINLYVKDTIEQDVYETLKNRIGAFEEVVGPLQPILAEMPRILRKVARGELELEEARRLLKQSAAKTPPLALEALETTDMDKATGSAMADRLQAPASQSQLAAWCLAHPAPGMRIRMTPEPGTDSMEPDGMRACLAINWVNVPPELGIDPTEEPPFTFSGPLADRHPPTAPAQDDEGNPVEGREGVRLLTWGDPYLTAWLEAIRGPGLQNEASNVGK